MRIFALSGYDKRNNRYEYVGGLGDCAQRVAVLNNISEGFARRLVIFSSNAGEFKTDEPIDIHVVRVQ